MRILGIETSCDETGIAIYDSHKGLLVNKIHSQVKLHADYGGIVPELASRDHIIHITPMIKSVLSETRLNKQDIHGIAYTGGPGLRGSLIVGASLGRALAYSWNVPSIVVHHMEGHLMSPMLEENYPSFPFVALLISGGHTQLIFAKAMGKYTLLGESIDDAVGEAFDKTAKLLGLGYPGGKRLSNLAKHGRSSHYKFPRPMTAHPGLSFSFSGLKTFASNVIKVINIHDEQQCADIARAFEDAVIEIFQIKCNRALDLTGCDRLIVAGGVSANMPLRSALRNMMQKRKGEVFYARPELCTDNGAMIAYVGMLRLKYGSGEEQKNNLTISVKPSWPIDELPMLVEV